MLVIPDFNTAGAWSSTVMESQGLLFTVVLDMGVNWVETTKRKYTNKHSQ